MPNHHNSHHTPSHPKSAIDWQNIPKVVLHDHLDGGLRPETLVELCNERLIPLPADTPAKLARWIQANSHSGSLERYLQGFGLTVSAMASVEACERVAFEAAEDIRLEGGVLAEFRMAPLLLEPFGIRGEEAVEAMLAGLKKSAMPSGLIVCALRSESPENVIRAAALAVKYRDKGVVAFDIAGAERGFPPAMHASAFAIAREAGLGITCHAGEADSGARVIEAAKIGATRIGHGVNIMRSEKKEHLDWIAEARDRKLHFEVCPTSNVHTGAAESLATHPLRAMIEAGLSVSCSPDNRLMSGVSESSELEAAHEQNGLTMAQVGGMMWQAARASFMPEVDRQRAQQSIEQWMVNAGLGTPWNN